MADQYTPTTEQACEHCPDGHENPESRPWAVFVALERDGDGQPTHLYVAPTAGQHVAESDAEWARARLNMVDAPLALYGKRWLAERLAAHEAEVRERIAQDIDERAVPVRDEWLTPDEKVWNRAIDRAVATARGEVENDG